MGNYLTRNEEDQYLSDKQMKRFRELTGLSPTAIEEMHARYMNLKGDSKLLKASHLTKLFAKKQPVDPSEELSAETLQNPVADFVVNAMFRENATTEMTFEQFICSLAKFQHTGNPICSLRAKAAFLFNVYDLDRDGVLNRSDLSGILDRLLSTYPNDYNIDSIAGNILHEFKTNEISFEQFMEVLEFMDIETKMSMHLG